MSNVFAATIDKVHKPIFSRIEFEHDLSRTGSASCCRTASNITRPSSPAAAPAGRTPPSRSTGRIATAFLAAVEMTGEGVVR